MEGVLDSKIFARSLVDFVRKSAASDKVQTEELHASSLVELLFRVATKIRLDVDILPAWFYPERDPSRSEGSANPDSLFVGATRKHDFPLFYLLIEYVYHDGPVGDFARTGLLYLTETASKSKGLEKWMIESDLATIMASGLGALYSRLSRRLPLYQTQEELPPILALSNYAASNSQLGELSTDSQYDMNAFLSYLMFWQDTLDHCTSAEVADTLIDHFQVLFLQQLLYPSLLESSDVEGGSTASVITYLSRILQSLNHPPLVQRMLQYLFASSNQDPGSGRSTGSQRMSLSRRKSLNHLAFLSEAQENPSPDLFNLLDLIIMSLRSRRSQTTTSSLKLVSVILQRHHGHVLFILFKPRSIPKQTPQRTIGALNVAMAELFVFALAIGEDDLMEQSYENVLNDVSIMLESHVCSIPRVGSKVGTEEKNEGKFGLQHSILMEEITQLLNTFFSNQAMTNLALTEAIVTLACCKRISFEGWLFPSQSSETRTAELTRSITTVIEGLVNQVRQWQVLIPDWSTLIAAQKDRLKSTPHVDSVESRSTPGHSRQSLESDHQSLTGWTDRQSMEVPPQGRKPRTLQSEVFGSIDGSLSSPSVLRTVAQRHPNYGSPLRETGFPPASEPSLISPPSRSVSSNLGRLESPILLPRLPRYRADGEAVEVAKSHRIGFKRAPEAAGDDFSSGAVTPSERGTDHSDQTVNLGQVLVNAIILQEFVLEIIAVIQIRASLFGEVSFE